MAKRSRGSGRAPLVALATRMVSDWLGNGSLLRLSRLRHDVNHEGE
jgi:hypothetical protein